MNKCPVCGEPLVDRYSDSSEGVLYELGDRCKFNHYSYEYACGNAHVYIGDQEFVYGYQETSEQRVKRYKEMDAAIVKAKQAFLTHQFDACEKGCNGCMYCDGGLKSCLVCGGAEGSLPSCCPGYRMSWLTERLVYDRDIDMRDGRWIIRFDHATKEKIVKYLFDVADETPIIRKIKRDYDASAILDALVEKPWDDAIANALKDRVDELDDIQPTPVYNVGPDEWHPHDVGVEYKWIVAWYEIDGYEGSGEAWGLVRGTDIVENSNLGHCSCYGPGEDWGTGKGISLSDLLNSEDALAHSIRTECITKIRELNEGK